MLLFPLLQYECLFLSWFLCFQRIGLLQNCLFETEVGLFLKTSSFCPLFDSLTPSLELERRFPQW